MSELHNVKPARRHQTIGFVELEAVFDIEFELDRLFDIQCFESVIFSWMLERQEAKPQIYDYDQFNTVTFIADFPNTNSVRPGSIRANLIIAFNIAFATYSGIAAYPSFKKAIPEIKQDISDMLNHLEHRYDIWNEDFDIKNNNVPDPIIPKIDSMIFRSDNEIIADVLRLRSKIQ